MGSTTSRFAELLSPVNGVVVEILKHPGEWVEPGEKVLRIVSIDRLRAEGLVHVSKLPANLVGAPVTISVELPDKGATTFKGKVVFVSPEISPVNGQARVWAEIDNSSGLLRPGLRPQMKIEMPGAEVATREMTITKIRNIYRARLRMRPDLICREQRTGSQEAWVVKDPVSLRYFTLTPQEFAILSGSTAKTASTIFAASSPPRFRRSESRPRTCNRSSPISMRTA